MQNQIKNQRLNKSSEVEKREKKDYHGSKKDIHRKLNE